MARIPPPECPRPGLERRLRDAGMRGWMNNERVQSGNFYGWSRAGGLGVGVYSPRSRDKLVSLFHINSQRPNRVYFRAQRLRYYLPDIPLDAIDRWIHFIHNALHPRNTASYHVVQRALVEENLDEVLRLMEPLRGCVS